jgi:cbb3-type cytochrome oxidase cytochrome c subunit
LEITPPRSIEPEVKGPKKVYWKNEAYWRLPENVRNAVDLAKIKSKHSEFWYRLETLNDKIFVFRSIFYSQMPSFQKQFYKKKEIEMHKKLQEEK